MAIHTVVPTELQQLRACLLCGLVKTVNQFQMNGCENCEEFLKMQGDRDKVYECSSANFDGLLAMMCPSESWIARWQMIDKLTPGVYAASVYGSLPREVIHYLRSKGIPYREVIHYLRQQRNSLQVIGQERKMNSTLYYCPCI
ncbi:Transcription elongation factor SPT4 [Fasciola gigantica]|uniref:Transcription elongation factor SPT4 n=1 Tax=Fasciola gigantica TaxID=46835 RepID=A0A504Y506_FASGI|nr:Transcription elongation factor SPT4 [Fasciola gigantica]